MSSQSRRLRVKAFVALRGVSRLRFIATVLLMLGGMAIMLLSAQQMSDLRVALPPLSESMSWLEGLPLPLDMDHVAFFTLVAGALRLLLPDVRARWLLLVLGALAVGTELLQFMTVGRTPSILDARDDMIGAGIGLLLGSLLRWAASGAGALLKLGNAWLVSAAPCDQHGLMMRALTSEPSTHVQRRAIAGWIVGDHCVSPAMLVEADGLEAVLAAIEREGVVSLVYARFCDTAQALDVPEELRAAIATRARAMAARGLLCLTEARRIQHALDQAGIPALWMKGIALGLWLYPQPCLRDVADMDLLLPDHATTLRAASVLAPLGYVLPNPHIAGDLVVHELLAWSKRAQLELDLHWDLSNDALFAGRLRWDALQTSAKALPQLAGTARGLSPLHALLHAVMHRAANYRSGRENRLRWLYDIHLLVGGFKAEQWQQLATLAVIHGVAGPCLDALHASRDLLGTSVPDAVTSQLHAASSAEYLQSARLRRWGYFQWANWQALPDLRTRLRWLRQLLLPDMAHLHARYGGDGAGAIRVVTRRMLDGWHRWRGYHRAVDQ